MAIRPGGAMRATAMPPGVAACLTALGFPDEAWRGHLGTRIHSAVHEAVHDGRRVAIKACFDARTHAPDGAAARREFLALERVSEAVERRSTAPLVPEPLTLCETHGAYAMTFVPGIPATAHVLSRARQDAASVGTAAGRWLRRFHDAHLLGERRGDFVAKLAFVEAMLRDPNVQRDAFLRHAMRTLAATAAAAAAVTMPASWIHGDMKSDNLLVDGERVIGLDVHVVDENVVVYDLAPFVNHLMLLRRQPRHWLRRAKLQRMADAFLDAYSPDVARWSMPLAWLRGYLLAQPLAAAAGSWRRAALVAERRELAVVVDRLRAAA